MLTDTPEKNELEAEQNKSKKNKEKNLKKVKRKIVEPDEDSEDDEYFCLVCAESYSGSKPGDDWIMCSSCKLWAHEACTDAHFPYVCHNCDSDYDDN